MARRWAADINLLGFSLLNAMIHPVGADPSGLGAGDAGRVWFNTTSGKLMYWTGLVAIDVLNRANHSGTQTASTISDFMSQVVTARLDQMAQPTADVNFGARKAINLLDGSANTDAATYGQVLALINNQVFKTPARVATTTTVGTLAGGAPSVVDGVTVVVGDRVLVKDQTTQSTNGIYTVQTVGTGANGTWVRATDADTANELPPGSVIPVNEGTAQADRIYLLATNGPIVLGTTALSFIAYGVSTGEIVSGGDGLVKTGTILNVVAGVGITVAPDSVAVDYAITGRKVTGAIPAVTAGIFTVSGASVVINHGLNNLAPNFVLRVGGTPIAGYVAGHEIGVDNVATDANNLTVTLPAAPATGNWAFTILG